MLIHSTGFFSTFYIARMLIGTRLKAVTTNGRDPEMTEIQNLGWSCEENIGPITVEEGLIMLLLRSWQICPTGI